MSNLKTIKKVTFYSCLSISVFSCENKNNNPSGGKDINPDNDGTKITSPLNDPNLKPAKINSNNDKNSNAEITEENIKTFMNEANPNSQDRSTLLNVGCIIENRIKHFFIYTLLANYSNFFKLDLRNKTDKENANKIMTLCIEYCIKNNIDIIPTSPDSGYINPNKDFEELVSSFMNDTSYKKNFITNLTVKNFITLAKAESKSKKERFYRKIDNTDDLDSIFKKDGNFDKDNALAVLKNLSPGYDEKYTSQYIFFCGAGTFCSKSLPEYLKINSNDKYDIEAFIQDLYTLPEGIKRSIFLKDYNGTSGSIFEIESNSKKKTENDLTDEQIKNVEECMTKDRIGGDVIKLFRVYDDSLLDLTKDLFDNAMKYVKQKGMRILFSIDCLNAIKNNNTEYSNTTFKLSEQERKDIINIVYHQDSVDYIIFEGSLKDILEGINLNPNNAYKAFSHVDPVVGKDDQFECSGYNLSKNDFKRLPKGTDKNPSIYEFHVAIGKSENIKKRIIEFLKTLDIKDCTHLKDDDFITKKLT